MNNYVRMADGSKRPISDIRTGDRIMDTNLRIITRYWTEKLIKLPAKPVNAHLIEEFTGV